MADMVSQLALIKFIVGVIDLRYLFSLCRSIQIRDQSRLEGSGRRGSGPERSSAGDVVMSGFWVVSISEA